MQDSPTTMSLPMSTQGGMSTPGGLTSYSSTGLLPSTSTQSTAKPVAVVTSQPANNVIQTQKAATQDLVNTVNTYKPLQTYLANNNQAFSQANLKDLATKYGITDYSGTDAQNTQLASLIQSKPQGGQAPTSQTGQQQANQTMGQQPQQGQQGQTPQKTTSVVSYKDNPDGTTTVTYADGTTGTGTYTRNNDGTYSFKETVSTGNNVPQMSPYQQQYMQQMDNAYNSYQNTIQQIFNGTFLTPDQQSQVSALQSTFDRMRQLQTNANQHYEQLQQQSAFRQGTNITDPTEFINEHQQAIQAGLDKITNIDVAATKALSELKQSFMDKNYKMANDAYSTLSSYLKEKNDVIQKTVDDAAKAEKDLRDYNFQVQKHQDDMNQAKQDKISEVQKTAAANHAPLSVIEAIGNAPNETTALSLAGKYMYNPLDEAYKQAQIDKIHNEIKTSGIQSDPGLVLAYAQQYASNGQIPTGLPKGTFGVVSQVAKELPKQAGEVVNANTGVKPQGNANYVDSLSNYYSLIQLAKELKVLDDKRIGGVVAGTLGKVFGSADQDRYLSLRNQITDLLTRVRTGAALNADEQDYYEAMLPGRFSEPFGLGVDSSVKIDNFINSLSKDVINKASSQGYSIYGMSTVKAPDGNSYTVGDIIKKGDMTGRINPDGTITIIQ